MQSVNAAAALCAVTYSPPASPRRTVNHAAAPPSPKAGGRRVAQTWIDSPGRRNVRAPLSPSSPGPKRPSQTIISSQQQPISPLRAIRPALAGSKTTSYLPQSDSQLKGLGLHLDYGESALIEETAHQPALAPTRPLAIRKRTQSTTSSSSPTSMDVRSQNLNIVTTGFASTTMSTHFSDIDAGVTDELGSPYTGILASPFSAVHAHATASQTRPTSPQGSVQSHSIGCRGSSLCSSETGLGYCRGSPPAARSSIEATIGAYQSSVDDGQATPTGGPVSQHGKDWSASSFARFPTPDNVIFGRTPTSARAVDHPTTTLSGGNILTTAPASPPEARHNAEDVSVCNEASDVHAASVSLASIASDAGDTTTIDYGAIAGYSLGYKKATIVQTGRKDLYQDLDQMTRPPLPLPAPPVHHTSYFNLSPAASPNPTNLLSASQASSMPTPALTCDTTTSSSDRTDDTSVHLSESGQNRSDFSPFVFDDSAKASPSPTEFRRSSLLQSSILRNSAWTEAQPITGAAFSDPEHAVSAPPEAFNKQETPPAQDPVTRESRTPSGVPVQAPSHSAFDSDSDSSEPSKLSTIRPRLLSGFHSPPATVHASAPPALPRTLRATKSSSSLRSRFGKKAAPPELRKATVESATTREAPPTPKLRSKRSRLSLSIRIPKLFSTAKALATDSPTTSTNATPASDKWTPQTESRFSPDSDTPPTTGKLRPTSLVKRLQRAVSSPNLREAAAGTKPQESSASGLRTPATAPPLPSLFSPQFVAARALAETSQAESPASFSATSVSISTHCGTELPQSASYNPYFAAAERHQSLQPSPLSREHFVEPHSVTANKMDTGAVRSKGVDLTAPPRDTAAPKQAREESDDDIRYGSAGDGSADEDVYGGSDDDASQAADSEDDQPLARGGNVKALSSRLLGQKISYQNQRSDPPQKVAARKADRAAAPARNPFGFSRDELSGKHGKLSKSVTRAQALRASHDQRPPSLGDRPHTLLLPQTDEQVKRRNGKSKSGLAPPLVPFVQDSVLTMSEASDDEETPIHKALSPLLQAKSPSLPVHSPSAIITSPSAALAAQRDSVHSKQRIYINDPQHHFIFEVTSTSTAADVLAHLRANGTIDIHPAWAVVEMWRTLGVERPLREFENLQHNIDNWSADVNATLLLVKKSNFAHMLKAPHPVVVSTTGSWAYMEIKRGKWVKRWVEVRDGSVYVGKSEKPKDATLLCSLTSFDGYVVPQACIAKMKAPKPFAFAIKSVDKVTMFENAAQDYIHYFSVKTEAERDEHIQRILSARSPLVHKVESSRLANRHNTEARHNLLELPASTPIAAHPHSGSIDRANSQSLRTNVPEQPFAQGSLLARGPSATRKEGSGLLDRAASAAKVSPHPASAAISATNLPSGRQWEKLNPEERKRALSEAERKARGEGKTLLEFGQAM